MFISMRFVLFYGIVVGLILARFSREKFGISFDTVLEVLIGGMVFGIIGARVYYVLFRLNHYLANPSQIFKIRDRGACDLWGYYCYCLLCFGLLQA
ncbi:MAG: prolipoprotein diacylglyceryl transferase [Clostridia bacterium]|nr:prolipoprotein diacylglyceryl transferase [Clostridia bacterium]